MVVLMMVVVLALADFWGQRQQGRWKWTPFWGRFLRIKTKRKMKLKPPSGADFWGQRQQGRWNRNPLLVPAFICLEWLRSLGQRLFPEGVLGHAYSGLKSKPPSGPGVNLSGVTKELGATVASRRSVGGHACLFWFEIETPFWSWLYFVQSD